MEIVFRNNYSVANCTSFIRNLNKNSHPKAKNFFNEFVWVDVGKSAGNFASHSAIFFRYWRYSIHSLGIENGVVEQAFVLFDHSCIKMSTTNDAQPISSSIFNARKSSSFMMTMMAKGWRDENRRKPLKSVKHAPKWEKFDVNFRKLLTRNWNIFSDRTWTTYSSFSSPSPLIAHKMRHSLKISTFLRAKAKVQLSLFSFSCTKKWKIWMKGRLGVGWKDAYKKRMEKKWCKKVRCYC